MLEKRYQTTPCFGIVPMVKTRFSDCDLFPNEQWQYVALKKIKLWYGTPRKSESKTNLRTLLGIQCTYINLIDSKKIKSNFHGGDLSSSDIQVKEIELSEGDYFTNFYIAFDEDIYHIKIVTKNQKFIEFGSTENKESDKKIKINDNKNNYLLQCFNGYYNENKVSALGCKYISKSDYVFIHLIEILRVRHLFKRNKSEKAKWSDKNNLKKLSYELKVIAMLCTLPDAQFYSVIKYCI